MLSGTWDDLWGCSVLDLMILVIRKLCDSTSTQKLLRMTESQVFRQGLQTSLIAGSGISQEDS